MNSWKAVWCLLFRLFPCPPNTGLYTIGRPGPDSPVLVTCNFYTTVRRLMRRLRKDAVDAWLVVADSKGVNVWCAAGGDEFNTHTVVSALKTCGIDERVKHRHLVLPPLGAPAIVPDVIHEQTGWSCHWGPVYAEDIAQYLANGRRRDERMKRVTYDWRERLDTALGSLFPFYLFAAIGFGLLAPGLLLQYLVVGAFAFVVFMLACPWLPTEHGITKALALAALCGVILFLSYQGLAPSSYAFRSTLMIAMASVVLYGSELGGLGSTTASDLDPFLARLGIGAVGNVALAGTVRTELLNGYRRLHLDEASCDGCRHCAEICPQGVWEMNEHKHAVLARLDDCTACRACLTQCAPSAIQAPRT